MASIANGMTAPAATSPLNLFSMVSSTSSGFFKPGGTTVPNASFSAQTATISSAGSQNEIFAYHGKASRAAESFAVKYLYAPYALVPRSGEMAMPVTVEIAVAIGAAGERSPLGAGAAAVAASRGVSTTSTSVARSTNGA